MATPSPYIPCLSLFFRNKYSDFSLEGRQSPCRRTRATSVIILFDFYFSFYLPLQFHRYILIKKFCLYLPTNVWIKFFIGKGNQNILIEKFYQYPYAECLHAGNGNIVSTFNNTDWSYKRRPRLQNSTDTPNKIVAGRSQNWTFGVNYADWALRNGPFMIL